MAWSVVVEFHGCTHSFYHKTLRLAVILRHELKSIEHSFFKIISVLWESEPVSLNLKLVSIKCEENLAIKLLLAFPPNPFNEFIIA